MQQAPSAYSTALTDTHTRKNGHIAANPAVLFDDNVSTECRSAAALTTSGVDGVGGTDELDVGAEDTSIADGDRAGVRDTAVGANEHIISNVNVVAIIAMEGCFDSDFRSNATYGHDIWLNVNVAVGGWCWLWGRTTSHDLTKATLAFFRTGTMRRVGGIVEAPDGGHAILAILSQGWTERGVVVALEHLVTFDHVVASLGW